MFKIIKQENKYIICYYNRQNKLIDYISALHFGTRGDLIIFLEKNSNYFNYKPKIKSIENFEWYIYIEFLNETLEILWFLQN
jgi:hypothetical protein